MTARSATGGLAAAVLGAAAFAFVGFRPVRATAREGAGKAAPSRVENTGERSPGSATARGLGKTDGGPRGPRLAGTIHIDPERRFQILLPEGWRPVALADPPPPTLLFAAGDATDQMLVVSRVVGPTENAHGDPAVLASLETGLASRATGYRRLSVKKRLVGRRAIPAYDLWFAIERAGRPVTMAARFLFYPGHALSVLVDAPSPRARRVARRIVESFAPVD